MYFIIFYLLSIGLIAALGLVEISKITDFQRFERNHLECLDVIITDQIHLETYKQVLCKKEINNIIFRTSDVVQEKGINQNIDQMIRIVDNLFLITNFLERRMFILFGFGQAFEIAEADYKRLNKMNQAINNYQNGSLDLDSFLAELKQFTSWARVNDQKFMKIVHEAGHFISQNIIILVFSNLFIGIFLVFFIFRNLFKQVDRVIVNFRTSSEELEIISRDQLGSISEQTSAVVEISSVMNELVATSRHISETATKTFSVAKATNQSVEDGEVFLSKTLNGINMIKEKEEITTSNMLSLGKKSQQIGIVLDVIKELSQQVTVLSYNATIEAAGAGEKGKRFMAVADRIIKLAERSAESGKEIKDSIDGIQADSSKASMSTENTAKAVKEGLSYSMEIRNTLEKISDSVKEMTSFTEQIDISSRQQSTGVEQVAAAVEDIASLAERNKEASNQILKTANQLADMAESMEKL